METIKFNPEVYVIETNRNGNVSTWALLTVDNNTPRETIYFLQLGDCPSFNDADKINEAIESENWEKMSLADSGLEIKDFDISLSVFDCAPGYEEIVEELKIELEYLKC